MKIGEIAELTGVPTSTLRDWEKYLELKIPKDENGDRFYAPAWVDYFKQVKELVSQGKSFAEIKALLTPPADIGPPGQEELEQLRKQIQQLESEVTSLRETLITAQEASVRLREENIKLKEQLASGDKKSNKVLTAVIVVIVVLVALGLTATVINPG